MGLLHDIFTWWNGAPLSTKLYTASRGKRIGQDQFGNTYYEDTAGNGPAGKPRRWVIYAGYADASTVPAEWFGWLHYIVDVPPAEETYQQRAWEKPHVPNMTGTPKAYRPPGSLLREDGGRRPRADGDYQPWDADS
jgi:NADH:ubiquinone oxidoreductase subunit